MNAIVLGQSTKMAEILQSFCDKVYLVIDKSAECARTCKELEDYSQLDSYTSMFSAKGILPRAKELVGWIKQYDLTIIFSQTKYDMVAAKLASILVRKKVVLLGTSHNSYAWQNPSSVRKMSWLIKASTDCYIALASFVFNQLRDLGVKEEKLHLMPNTVEYAKWAIKDNYEYNGAFKLVYVAYVYDGKRQHVIAEVLNKLKDKYNIQCDCYGDVDSGEHKVYAEKVQSLINKYGLEDNMRLCGRVDNELLRSKLSEYDAYICPTLMEMSPVNVMEAQAAGLPVIASNVGGMPDLIHDGVDGLLFECDNIDDISDKLVRFIEDKTLREKLGKQGRKQVSELYNSKIAGERLYGKIKNLLK